jgi:cold shock CspA family protein
MRQQQGIWKVGHVDGVDRRKGIAFIRPQGERGRVFAHFGDIASDDERLCEGDLVRFLQVQDGKGWRAQEIRRLRS